MAGDDHYRRCRVDGCVAKKAEAELGILVVPFEQCALDCLGCGRPGMGAHRFAACAGGNEYSRGRKESTANVLSLFYFAVVLSDFAPWREQTSLEN